LKDAEMQVPNTYGELNPCGGGDTIPLFKRKLTIGRRSNCDIILNFPNVSSYHCEMELLNGYWFIKDLGSSNGIKVNDTRFESRYLMPGDLVSIAKHAYHINYTPVGEMPVQEEVSPFSRSLMELAGLDRPRRAPPQKAPAPPARPKPAPKHRPEDDEAMKYLNGDLG
jgi:adenylate cyclase